MDDILHSPPWSPSHTGLFSVLDLFFCVKGGKDRKRGETPLRYPVLFIGGKNMRGGEAPSLFNSPLQPYISVDTSLYLWLERG
jgi:hypothetical protein